MEIVSIPLAHLVFIHRNRTFVKFSKGIFVGIKLWRITENLPNSPKFCAIRYCPSLFTTYIYNSLIHNNLPFTQCSQLREEVATLRDKLSFQVEERSQIESTTTQLKDKLHQAEVSHSSTKGEVSSTYFIVYIPKFLWDDEFHEQMFLFESNLEYVGNSRLLGHPMLF